MDGGRRRRSAEATRHGGYGVRHHAEPTSYGGYFGDYDGGGASTGWLPHGHLDEERLPTPVTEARHISQPAPLPAQFADADTSTTPTPASGEAKPAKSLGRKANQPKESLFRRSYVWPQRAPEAYLAAPL